MALRNNSGNELERPLSIVDEVWEVLDPIPNIHSLFIQFNRDYFWDALVSVEVRWSPRMTLCAGLCCYEGRGGLCSVRLSQPLLKYRPRRDLVETLLHEMIHAYLFVTHNNKDHDAHGPEFLKHMRRINEQTGTKITVYHNFNAEVDIHRQHWWKCDGPCQHRKPFYGLVKRSMNRAPAPTDPWWADHQAKCGGTYRKIKEPENYKEKTKTKENKSKINEDQSNDNDIRSFFSPPATSTKTNVDMFSDISNRSIVKSPVYNKSSNIHTIQHSTEVSSNVLEHFASDRLNNVHSISSSPSNKASFVPFSGKGFVLGAGNSKAGVLSLSDRAPPSKRFKSSEHKTCDKKINEHRNNFKMPKSNFSRNGGTLTTGNSSGILSRSVGSKTIVLNNPKLKTSPAKNMTPKKEESVYFTGAGHLLGEGSSSNNSKSTTLLPSMKQEAIETFFKSTPPRNLNDSNKKNVFIFSSDSEDDEIEILSKSDNVTFNNASNDISKIKVQCPICGESIKNEIINSHLDSCLQKSCF